MTLAIDLIQFEKNVDHLVPAVIQDAATNQVLMLGFMNRAALVKTLDTGSVTFWKRSTQKLWTKGETSGNVLKFVSLRINCNNDSLLIMADPVGATCHTGHPTCYYRQIETVDDDWQTITTQQFDPADVYKS